MAGRNRANRLDSVIRIAEDEEQKAFAELAKCREEIVDQEQKLKDLEGYREEYHEGMREPGMFSPQQMRNRYQFLQKVEAAISGQQEQITAWGEEEERLRRIWMEKRVRRRALNKASEQRLEQMAREEKRQEQRRTDDLARQNKEF